MAKDGYMYNKIINFMTSSIGDLVLMCSQIGDMVKKLNFIKRFLIRFT